MIEYVGVFVICAVGSAATGVMGYLRGRRDATRDLTKRDRFGIHADDPTWGEYLDLVEQYRREARERELAE